MYEAVFILTPEVCRLQVYQITALHDGAPLKVPELSARALRTCTYRN